MTALAFDSTQSKIWRDVSDIECRHLATAKPAVGHERKYRALAYSTQL